MFCIEVCSLENSQENKGIEPRMRECDWCREEGKRGVTQRAWNVGHG